MESSTRIALRNDVGFFWISTALLLVLAVFGVGLDGIAVGPFDLPPFILYLVFHGFLVLALMISRSEYALDFPGPMLVLLLFAMYVLGSSFWAADTLAATKEMILIVTSIFTGLFLYWGVADRWTLSRYISVLKLVALVGIAIAVVEIATGTHLPVSKRHGTASYYRSTAWYVNENDFSMFLAMVSFLFLADALSVDQLKTRIVGAGGFAACLLIVLENDSRAALLAVFVVSVLVVGLSLGQKRVRTPGSGRTRLAVFTRSSLVGAVAVVGLALIISNPFDPHASRSLWFRWQALEVGVFTMFDTVVGGGVGSFPTVWGQSTVPPAVEANAHNWFVTLIGEYGVVGTVLFLLAYGRTADGLLETYLRDRDPAALGLLGALLAFALAGLGPSGPIPFQIQWIIFGLGIAASYRISPAISRFPPEFTEDADRHQVTPSGR